jgi:UDP-GlcNAc:undecaprenyl-phosphate GlcNAc-1-phosphate transferase
MKKVLYILSVLFFTVLLTPYVKKIFFEGGFRWLYILFFSTSLSFFLTPIMRLVAFRFKMLDIPSERKLHSEPTPLLGGLGVYIAVVIPLLLNQIMDRGGMAILLGGTGLFLLGIINDKKEIPASIRLLVQIIITAFIIRSGISLTLFTEDTFMGSSVNLFLSVLWIVGITNSMNFFDGMDGLAAGLSIITAFFIGMIAFMGEQPILGWMAVAILGASLGFLPYNLRVKGPATIFLGESGSAFLGFLLSSLAIKGEWSENNPLVSLTAPLLIFAVFIYDTIYITISRVLGGRVKNFREWIDYVGKDHIHHRMDALLQGKRKSVILIYFIAVSLGLTALLIKRATTEMALLLLFQAIIILGIITILEREGNRRMRG